MILLVNILLPLLISVHTLAQEYPSCYQEGITWQHTDVIDAIPVSESAFACQTSCMTISSCSSFTWYSMSSPLTPQLCILYKSTHEELPCPTCVSGPASCTCSSDYACRSSDGNLLDLLPQTLAELECLMSCVSTPGCQVYTWYDQMAAVFTHDCFLFSSCNEVDLECVGCHSGPQDCAGTTTATVGPTTEPNTDPSTDPTTAPTTCNSPESHLNGSFDCFSTESLLTCDLLCDPGYAVSHGSRTYCTDGFWQREPEEMICEPTILLVTGGSIEPRQAELYSTDGSISCSLNILPESFYKHTVQYVDGDILMVEAYNGPTNDYGKTYTLESDGRWVAVSSAFLGDSSYSYRSVATTTVQRADMFATVEYYTVYGSYYYSTVVKMSPALSYDWKEMFAIVNRGSSDLSKDVPCSVAVSWDTYVTTGVYENGTYANTRLVNTANQTVTYLQPMNVERKNHGCTHYRQDRTDFILVAGGQNNEDIASSEILNLSTGQWEMAGNLSLPRRGLCLAVVEGGKVIATGIGHMKGVEEFDIEQKKWKTVETPLRLMRNDHAVTAIPASLLSCQL